MEWFRVTLGPVIFIVGGQIDYTNIVHLVQGAVVTFVMHRFAWWRMKRFIGFFGEAVNIGVVAGFFWTLATEVSDGGNWIGFETCGVFGVFDFVAGLVGVFGMAVIIKFIKL